MVWLSNEIALTIVIVWLTFQLTQTNSTQLLALLLAVEVLVMSKAPSTPPITVSLVVHILYKT